MITKICMGAISTKIYMTVRLYIENNNYTNSKRCAYICLGWISCHLHTKVDQLVGQYFSEVLRVRDASARSLGNTFLQSFAWGMLQPSPFNSVGGRRAARGRSVAKKREKENPLTSGNYLASPEKPIKICEDLGEKDSDDWATLAKIQNILVNITWFFAK